MLITSWSPWRRSKKIWVSFCIGLLIVGILTFSSSPTLGVKEERFIHLTQGINLSHWFSQAPLTHKNFQTRVTAKDIQRIKKLGFRHVRLPIDPDVLLNETQPEKLNQENLKYFDMALDMILAENLGVIVDIHPKPQFKQRLYKDMVFVNTVAKFWKSLAQHLSTTDPELVFLEVLNEPDAKDPKVWYKIQPKLLTAMRAGAPSHTLIASANIRVGKNWSDIEALQLLSPVQDSNVVYNFHFYKPNPFVSQGATWGWDMLRYFRSVPYPSNPASVKSVLPKIKNEAARKHLQIYGKERWDAQKLEELIKRAATWAQKHQVRLTCNEFGVYRRVAPPDDRNVWINDVRSLLEKYNIGWSMWDYNHGFGVMKRVKGELIPDLDTLQALFA
ncbi:glycoside hydrolase family 5 protein [Gloeocapsopsis dulcis]|uniref:Glycoside hydrolase family 5 domain-containing protein n=1 Tax=Gloeocapsopsis dulcis AAB1 = 1H9 TaxID=1433147 RepID=A0A6N8FU27_9CHRO|nr:cellulase family glycosylhydrolase [Gloeocapsopsis dulcis]MUL35815.1 hypothetical protein [Gloeocapsopsis dulcis AAB1 = 1H9]WNN87718.1 cellulase family glycosylhydrolase [Gloeocapsopsis dulcis]